MNRRTRDFEVATAVPRHELAFARVLADSLARYHSGKRLQVVVLDDPEEAVEVLQEPFEWIRPQDLELGPGSFHRLTAACERKELVARIQPEIFRHLLDRGAPVVVFLDPAVELFAPIDGLVETARRHRIALVARSSVPGTSAAAARRLAHLGIYDPGCLAVGREARDFLDGWSRRLALGGDRTRKEEEPEEPTTERWLELVPLFYPHALVRDPALNVAYWNLDHRDLCFQDGRFEVEGEPLVTFQFQGFDPEKPYLLSCREGVSSRIRLSERPALARLCAERAERLLARGHTVGVKRPGYARTAAGLPIDERIRRICHRALRGHDESGEEAFPDPFDPALASQFTDWLRLPRDRKRCLVSRYLEEVYNERPDLRSAFPDLAGRDAARYVEWLRTSGVVQPPVPKPLFPGPDEVDMSHLAAWKKRPLKAGVNLVGYVWAESGVGEVARLLATVLEEAQVPYSVIPFSETLSRQEHRFDVSQSREPIYDTNLICINADQLPVFINRFGTEILEGRYTIGVWAWEVEHFPQVMRGSAAFVDEVWGISRHTAESVAPFVDCPVFAFPLPVCQVAPVELGRQDLDLPAGFLFLFCFDFDSVFERKNPLAVVEAFRNTFSPDEGAALLVKSINGDRHPDALEHLRMAATGRDDIVIRDGYLTAEKQRALMAHCDAYVSLHRAEGFGLTLAEAMGYGKPVIATGYSANLDFMNDGNSYLVPFRRIPIVPGCGPYTPGARWAEPDVAAAGDLLREVFDDPVAARAKGERARQDIERYHSPPARVAQLRERLAKRDQLRRQPAISRLPAEAPTDDTAGSPPGLTDWEQRAETLLRRGPAVDSPTRYGFLGSLFRRIVLRLLRNFHLHQQEVAWALLRASQERSRLEADAVRQEIAAVCNETGPGK